MSASRPLWECPRCGAKLVLRNLSHACGDYSVEKFLAGKGPAARRLFERFTELVRACGPVELAPAKTRVAFMVRVRFASVNRLSEGGLSAHVWLRRKLTSRRFQRIEQFGPRCFVHHFRVTAPEQLDDEVLDWLREAYRVGCGAGK